MREEWKERGIQYETNEIVGGMEEGRENGFQAESGVLKSMVHKKDGMERESNDSQCEGKKVLIRGKEEMEERARERKE